jgi:hypothetical protein
MPTRANHASFIPGQLQQAVAYGAAEHATPVRPK